LNAARGVVFGSARNKLLGWLDEGAGPRRSDSEGISFGSIAKHQLGALRSVLRLNWWRSVGDVRLSMTSIKARLVFTLFAIWCCISMAAPTPVPVRAEIDALLARLQTSGCQFSRNGTSYSGSKAKEHLLRKLKYIEDRGTVQSTEQFIELAASSSSSSGKPYEVRCGSAAPIKSQQWLTNELAALRSSSDESKSKP
jgi:Family of unknown function (DUF5329)